MHHYSARYNSEMKTIRTSFKKSVTVRRGSETSRSDGSKTAADQPDAGPPRALRAS